MMKAIFVGGTLHGTIQIISSDDRLIRDHQLYTRTSQANIEGFVYPIYLYAGLSSLEHWEINDRISNALIKVDDFLSREIKMDFSQALKELKDGKKVARSGWNGKGMFIFLVGGSTFQVNRPPLLGIYQEGSTINYRPHIDMKDAEGMVVPWLASQTDILADDWETVE